MKQLNVIWSKVTALCVLSVITKNTFYFQVSYLREDKIMMSTRNAGVRVNDKESRRGLGCSFALGENNDVQFLK